MPRARKHLVCLDSTPYYHVMSRCVRRAFLCGVDRASGRSYEHRRDWVEGRARVLSSLFAVELCAYAIMNNHYHLVLRIVPSEAQRWSADEVLERWTSLFRGPLLVQRYRQGIPLSEPEQQSLAEMTEVYRQRLASLSWFMKCLNEPIARKANAEDGCTGHFWEARFQSQALCSDQALLAAMAYVDLNPVRASMARTPEASDHTSIQARIDPARANAQLTKAVANLLATAELRHWRGPVRPLAPFVDEKTGASRRDTAPRTIPVHWPAYLELMDKTGRLAVLGKRGRIDPAVAPVLERLGLTAQQWLAASSDFRSHYRHGDLRLASTN